MSMLSNLKLPSGVSGLSGLGTSGLSGKLMQKRSWLVIVGDEAPVGEVNNAKSLTTTLRRKLNVVPLNAWPSAKASSRTRLSQFTNILLVGGPIASEFNYNMNDLLEPKCNIVKTRDRLEGETWSEYIIAGGIKVTGFLVNGVALAGAEHLGIIGMGTQKMGIRSSQIVTLSGWKYEDTCVLVKAFTEGAGAGAYNTFWTAKVPNMDVNPEGMSYTLRS